MRIKHVFSMHSYLQGPVGRAHDDLYFSHLSELLLSAFLPAYVVW